MKPVVVAGAVAAGMSAACGMPYFVGGEIESYENLAADSQHRG
ncbi:MAG: hypothetical protein ACQETQ_12695 [Spirochaetota bacterium]